MSLGTLLLFVLGFVLLLGGAEILVRGASRLAAAIGVSPLVVGLTVVAFGTSSPEIAVSVKASLEGNGDIAFGNAVGSNIANILLVLGLSAAVAPLVVAENLVRLDVPIMIGAAALVAVLALDGGIGRADGIVLMVLLAGYTAFTIRASRRALKAVKREFAREFGEEPEKVEGAGATARNLLLVAAGFGLLVYGSDLLVDGAVTVAEALGVSQLVIGLTIVAVGTSLPEIATSVMASVRGERDIAVGNVVGSNIFNMLAVLGVAGSVAPSGVPASDTAMGFDVPLMLAASIACLPVFFNGYRIARWEGLLFLGYYAGYTGWLVLSARDSPLLPQARFVAFYFAIPLTLVTLAVVTWREWRARRAAAARRLTGEEAPQE